MPETASLEAHKASPPSAARRDVRVVTPEQLVELRREQQEIYQSLRLNGSGPSDAARQIGIPRSLADQWERSGAASLPPETDAAAAPSGQGTPATEATTEPGRHVAAQVVRLDEDSRDLARQARASMQRLQRELVTLRRLLQRMEAAAAKAPAPAAAIGTPPPAPSGTAGIPSRAARSSLTAVLLSRGRARQHPPPAPRT
jgi:hypothetical protein